MLYLRISLLITFQAKEIPAMKTHIKICGITRPEDAIAAAQLGANALGLVFYPSSPRVVSIQQAIAISNVTPPFVQLVGLFVNASYKEIVKILAQVPLNLLQFHGEEPSEFCEQFQRPYIKALHIKENSDLNEQIAFYHSARGILLDTFNPNLKGGTGETFDWKLIPQHLEKPLILAGGLNAENVKQAILQIKPSAVDVSGGVEESKGIKSFSKMRDFIHAVQTIE
jgi:phosphoribosylanthranilate isomerase